MDQNEAFRTNILFSTMTSYAKVSTLQFVNSMYTNDGGTTILKQK